MWGFPTVKTDPELNIMEVFENTDLRQFLTIQIFKDNE